MKKSKTVYLFTWQIRYNVQIVDRHKTLYRGLTVVPLKKNI